VFAPLDDPQQIQWDTSGQYAVINDGNLWLLDCDTGTLTQLRADWVFSPIEPFDDRPVWSPNGHYAMMLGADDLLYAFDRDTGTLTELAVHLEKERTYLDIGWYWLNTEQLVIYNAAEPGMFIYDLSSLTNQHIDIELPSHVQSRLSPDNQLIAFVQDEAVIYNRETRRELRVRPAYGSLGTFSGGEVLWHDSGEWLFIFKDAIRAGGPVIRHLGIVRADGTMQRDLSYSWYPNSITLNWLPPQVDPADLPPPVERPLIPQPETVLHGSHWSFYADWSPDGRWIDAGLGWDTSGDITVWEVGTGKIVHIFEDAGEDKRVVWRQGEKFVAELGPVSEDEHILARSPDGRQLVQNGIQDGVWGTQVIDVDTGSVLTELQGEWNSTFVSADYDPDGGLLVAAYPYMPVRIWDTATWEIVATLPNPGQAVAFSPDGTQLAVTASWDVQIWDVATLLETGIRE
jgi:WD40 repeat protein